MPSCSVVCLLEYFGGKFIHPYDFLDSTDVVTRLVSNQQVESIVRGLSVLVKTRSPQVNGLKYCSTAPTASSNRADSIRIMCPIGLTPAS